MVGYAKSQADMPKWGQLGCSGFIILDAQRRVVCPATAAFLKMRGLAFAHVEALLDALMAAKFSKVHYKVTFNSENAWALTFENICQGEAVPTVCPAQFVVLDKVEDPKKMGMRGVALDATDPSSGKCNVFLLSGSSGGSMVRVSADKVRVLPGDALDISPRQLQAIEQARAVVLVSRQKELPATAPCDESADRKRNAEGVSKGGDAVDTPPLRQGGDGDQAAEALGPVRVASVLNDELDRQHEECAAALEELARVRCASALDVALRVIRRHFEFEELLLDKYLYASVAGGGASEGFSIDESMRKSHLADHNRIILSMYVHTHTHTSIKRSSSQRRGTAAAAPIYINLYYYKHTHTHTHTHIREEQLAALRSCDGGGKSCGESTSGG
jgi:hypothetical protein